MLGKPWHGPFLCGDCTDAVHPGTASTSCTGLGEGDMVASRNTEIGMGHVIVEAVPLLVVT